MSTNITQTKTLTVLAFYPGKPPVVEQMLPGLEAMQAFVGGYIEAVPFTADATGAAMLDVICNEEGKLDGLPFNRRFGTHDILCGNFYVSKVDSDGEAVSLTPEDIAIATAYFKGAEV